MEGDQIIQGMDIAAKLAEVREKIAENGKALEESKEQAKQSKAAHTSVNKILAITESLPSHRAFLEHVNEYMGRLDDAGVTLNNDIKTIAERITALKKIERDLVKMSEQFSKIEA